MQRVNLLFLVNIEVSVKSSIKHLNAFENIMENRQCAPEEQMIQFQSFQNLMFYRRSKSHVQCLIFF